ncbi:MAG: Alkyl hydroperoxide reductase/ Thiol specific antioxidant/ Mal allergen [Mucilaginibacter sp.]|nr:Alkyl hydroperoxide reductase/ Thiol specific antioxidant/ Mal allergen [Mucilaginibacter sp.]
MKNKTTTASPKAPVLKIIIRHSLLCIAFMALYTRASAQQKYVIEGKINGLDKDMKVMLNYFPSKGIIVRDSAIVKNGAFHMQGTIARPYKVNLYLRSFTPPPPQKFVIGQVVPSQDGQSFYLTAGTTTITGNSLASAVVSNPVQAEYIELQNSLLPVQKASGPNNLALFYAKNADSIALFKQRRAAFEKQYSQVNFNFVKKHPNSYVAFDLVQNYAIVIEDPESFEPMFNALSPQFKNSPEGKTIAHNLLMVKKFAIGQPIMEFTQNDVNGKPVSLSSLKGKYVLVDFWASWCGPCRMEYPFIHKAYDEFKNKNFEVIGVSLDDKKNLWVNAIKDNHFDWVEVCDLKGRQNEVAVAYGISAIPQSLLVDPNGIIIAKNLRGDDLIEKLKEVIKTDKL